MRVQLRGQLYKAQDCFKFNTDFVHQSTVLQFFNQFIISFISIYNYAIQTLEFSKQLNHLFYKWYRRPRSMEFFLPMTTNRHVIFRYSRLRSLEFLSVCGRNKLSSNNQTMPEPHFQRRLWQNWMKFFERQDKRLREFEERQDKLFNKLFPEAEHLAMNRKETLDVDKTVAVPLAIDLR